MIYSTILGGAEQVYIDYAKNLREQGHRVINISTFGAQINASLSPDYKIPNNPISVHLLGRLFVFLLALYYKPQLIICHDNRAQHMCVLSRWLLKIPVLAIAHYHGCKVKRGDYAGSVSPNITTFLIESGVPEEKIFTLNNMIYITHAYAQKSLFGKKDIVLGALGRIVPEKGFHHLINTIKILKSEGYNAKLIVGGAGGELENLTNKVKELGLEQDVTFMGWVYNKQDFFDKIDIFCLPSDKESFGLVILEAMNYSKPVITSADGGPKDIIQNKVHGLLVSQSGESFATAVKEIISTENLAENLTKNAYTCLHEKYSSSVIGKNLSNVISLIAKK
jgi:glycosyltransferase involved in cell wall biosynthesis